MAIPARGSTVGDRRAYHSALIVMILTVCGTLAATSSLWAQTASGDGTIEYLTTGRTETWSCVDWRPGTDLAIIGGYGSSTSDGKNLWAYDDTIRSASHLAVDEFYDNYGIAWRPDGTRVNAVSYSQVIQQYDCVEYSEYLTGVSKTRQDISWRPDNSYAVIVGTEWGDYGPRYVIEKFTGTSCTTLYTGVDYTALHGIDWSPLDLYGSYRAVMVGDNGLVLEYSESEGLYELTPPAGDYWDVAWRPQSDYCLLVGSSVVKLELSPSPSFTTIPGFTGSASGIDFSGDGSVAIIVGANGMILEYDAFSGTIQTLQTGGADLMDVSWNSDGDCALIVGSGGSCLRLAYEASDIMSLSSGGFSPVSIGITGETLYTYAVTYTDSLNHQPSQKYVVIDDLSYVMSSSDSNYQDGSLFTYSTTLVGDGLHEYYFLFVCSGGQYARLPETGAYEGPLTYPRDQVILSSGTVSPGEGTTGITLFTYSVLYRDTWNHAPVEASVTVDNGTTYGLTTSENDYLNGSVFSYSTVLSISGNHTYYFEFECSGGETCRLPAGENFFTGPITHSHELDLSSGAVSPEVGVTNETQFTYSIVYLDSANHAPTTYDVVIDGYSYGMSTSDQRYDDGALFMLSTVLDENGVHSYHFEFECSEGLSGRLPAVGEFTGPTTTLGDPDNNVPVLSWPEETGYIDDGVSPDSGDEMTTFEFRVTYTDEDINPPIEGYPVVYIMKGGENISGSPFPMTRLSGSYDEGAIYGYSCSLSNGTDYSYFFKAYDDQGSTATGDPTTIQSGPLVGMAETPSAPSEPRYVSAAAESGQVTLTWLAPLEDGGSSIVEYRIYRSTSPSSPTYKATVDALTSSFIDSDIAPGKTYYYWVSAMNFIGESNKSTPVSVETLADDSDASDSVGGVVGVFVDAVPEIIAAGAVAISAWFVKTRFFGSKVAREAGPSKKEEENQQKSSNGDENSKTPQKPPEA